MSKTIFFNYIINENSVHFVDSYYICISQCTIQQTLSIVVSFPGISRPGRESDHSSPSSAEDKKEWIYASAAPTFIACLVTSCIIYRVIHDFGT